MREYQAACEKIINQFDGYIAQYLGDGLLIYFGYPVAHEDDALRAVYSGLGILREMEQLNRRLQVEKNIRLDVRLGVHSGIVVVGEVGIGKRSERLALGDTTNIAARIESAAQIGTLVISQSTYLLVRGYFEIKGLGAHSLKGISEPMELYQVLGVSTAKSRLDIEEIKGLTPLVGRQQEMNLLLTRWEESRKYQTRVVLLNGIAGVGKSRLVRELTASASRDSDARIVQCFCSPYHENSAFYPIIEMLDRMEFHIHPGDNQEQKLGKIESFVRQLEMPLAQTVPLFATLLSIPIDNFYEPLPMTPEKIKQKTVEALMMTFLSSAQKTPVMLIIEDLHWIDASTLELISLILKQSPSHRILIVLTFRPEFNPPWGIQPHITSIGLSHLPPSESREVVRQIAERKLLPEEVVAQIVRKTDGIPLFVEELTKSVLESGQLDQSDSTKNLSVPAASLAIPETLHDALVARLDRLGKDKEIAQLGAVIGREFSFELYHALSAKDENLLAESLSHLVSSGILDQYGVPPTATYQFRHALMQDAAYQSLLKGRKSEYHKRIAHVLIDHFGDRLETRPEMIAHHYTEAGMIEEAIEYWYEAGIRAKSRWENLETIAHLNRGLQLISSLPESSNRDEKELAFRIALGPSLIVTKGYGSTEVSDVFTNARALCLRLGEKTELGQILWFLSVNYLVHGDYESALESAEESLKLGEEQKNDNYLIGAHFHLGFVFFGLADFEASHHHFNEAIKIYSWDLHEDQINLYGVDFGIFCPLGGNHALWHLGGHDRAIRREDEVLATVEKMEHPFSWAIFYDYAGVSHQFRREPEIVKDYAQAAKAICLEHNFDYYLGWAMVIGGWAIAALGKCEEGISEIHEGLVVIQGTGGKRSFPYYHALLAEVYWMQGQNEVGLQTLAQALNLVNQLNESWWEAEIHRLKGEILLSISSDNRQEAETSFKTALDISRKQKSISLELRAATSLSRLWFDQGNTGEAKTLLSGSIALHKEGFDTHDYIDAQELLNKL
jgi:predicted ATPase